MLVRICRLSISIRVKLRHFANVVANAARLLGTKWAMLRQLFAAHGEAQNLESQIVAFAKLFEDIADISFYGRLEKELVLLVSSLNIKNHHIDRCSLIEE